MKAAAILKNEDPSDEDINSNEDSENDMSSDENVTRESGNDIFEIDYHGVQGSESDDDDESASNEKPPTSVKSLQKAILFVGNIPLKATDADIKKIFKKKDIKIHGFRRKKEKGICYIDLANSDDSAVALSLNGQKLLGEPLKVTRAIGKDEPKVKARDKFLSNAQKRQQKKNAKLIQAAEENCKIFVKHLPEDVTESSLLELFPGAKRVDIPKKKNANKGKGFAYLLFDDEKQVSATVAEKNGIEYCGEKLLVDFVGSKSIHDTAVKQQKQHRKAKGVPGQTKVLFIKNLNYNTTKDSLLKYFKDAQEVRIATLPKSQKSRGYGYIEFTSPSAAEKALKEMQGTTIDDRQVRLDFASQMLTPPTTFSGKYWKSQGKDAKGNVKRPKGLKRLAKKKHVIQKTKGTQDSKNSGKVSPTKKTNKKQKSTDNL